MTDADTREDILLLAELAEVIGCVKLDTVAQSENLLWRNPEQIRATWDKIAGKFLQSSLKTTPLEQFLKWSVADRRSRTISPL